MIDYIAAGPQELDLVAPLWRKLQAHHATVGKEFSAATPCISWEQRRDGLRRKVCGGSLRTDLARDPGTGEYVGYCITSLTGDHKGEIESIYVDPDHRSRGIGDALMRRALQWLDDGGAKVKTLGVAAGNEVVFGFYRRYGFVPRATILQQIPEVQS